MPNCRPSPRLLTRRAPSSPAKRPNSPRATSKRSSRAVRSSPKASQDIGKTYVEEAKSAFETATADLKEIAAIKSPTELFQIQGKLARRNFDALVAFSSKSSEAFVKLANEGFAPLSGRVSLAADKISKAA